MTLTLQDQQAIVTAHNAYRSEPQVNTPALQWSSELAAGAQSWADHLATNVHAPLHSKAGDSRPAGTGENLALASPGSSPVAQMVDFWGKTRTDESKPSEQENFKAGTFPDISKTGKWSDAGHYSQVIWRSTTDVGCGIASDGDWDYLVCRYSSAGNMSGVAVPGQVVLPFADQDVITLQADNGRYVTHLVSSDPNWNPIEASAQWAASATEARAQFRVTVLPNNQIALKSDNGLLAQRVDRGPGLNPIEAHGTAPSIYNQFTVTVLPNNQIALKADNNLYLSRVDRGVQQPLEACKNSIDALCQLTVAVVSHAT